MNPAHLALCASEEWRDALRDWIIPFALAEARLGDDVLEIGPGPGLTTDLLGPTVERLTALELDAALAESLKTRLVGTNVEVVVGDATAMPFDDDRFSGAISFTMLHHVPTAKLQDQLFSEVARVLRPGGVFVASDSLAGDDLAAFHDGDVYNPVDPATLSGRLLTAGFAEVEVRSNEFGWAAHARR
ncbi:MAG TPA: class I SAM-dependent methyltransferase [Acidimicrobiales bacterium]|jgi:SAM-dependent methyltransferase|nr:class I SAM-dependent methyltransferase [Acidimicrobiales bacterium]